MASACAEQTSDERIFDHTLSLKARRLDSIIIIRSCDHVCSAFCIEREAICPHILAKNKDIETCRCTSFLGHREKYHGQCAHTSLLVCSGCQDKFSGWKMIHWVPICVLVRSVRNGALETSDWEWERLPSFAQKQRHPYNDVTWSPTLSCSLWSRRVK